ncbi:GDYXXLXY domain-containing protein [Paludibaculum fermentans]|uniref:GDYXXLXY domain-containing protein n=1 Tax=Paludibaculum fermentans TaxID=1473598 RepID=A0A7S7SM27_PALFE|nr:GDYXXLXY domain-containing protein [Paludibaculum fermentans]QOY90832.1 GDYXXLXY domain-containing protein [Paludibaculum fermentans]
MTWSRQSLILAALQCGIVLSMGGKLLYDRATCPRVWVKTAPYDPSLPLRGRYLALRLTSQPGDPHFVETNDQQVLFFVPEYSTSIEYKRNAEIWAEVTIPHKGPPRPIRLGFKQNGQIVPVDIN